MVKIPSSVSSNKSVSKTNRQSIYDVNFNEWVNHEQWNPHDAACLSLGMNPQFINCIKVNKLGSLAKCALCTFSQ